MVQRHGNTDVLEHSFSHICNRERNFTIPQGHQGVAQGGANHQNNIGGNNRNAPWEGHCLEDLMEPIALAKK